MQDSLDNSNVDTDLEDLYGSTIYHLFDKDIQEASNAKLVEEFLQDYSISSFADQSDDSESGDLLDFDADLANARRQRKIRPKNLEYIQDKSAVTRFTGENEGIVALLPAILPGEMLKTIERQAARDVNLIRRKLKVRRLKRQYFERAFKRLEKFEEINKAIIIKGLQRDILTEYQINQLRKKLNDKNISEEEIIKWTVNNLTEIIRQNKLIKIKNLILNQYTIFSFFGILFISLLFFSYQWFNYSKSMYFYNKGIVSLEKGAVFEAEGHFLQGFKIRPNVKQCNRYADTYIEKKNYKSAEEKYKVALGIKPNHYITLTNYVGLYINQRKFEKAEQVYSNYLNTHYPDDVDVLSWWGEMYIEWSKIDPSKRSSAVQVYEAVPKKEKNFSLLTAKDMNLSLLRNDYQSAKEKYHFLTTRYPKYLDMLSYLNWLEYLIKGYEDVMIDKKTTSSSSILFSQFKNDQIQIIDTITSLLDRFKESDYKDNPYFLYLMARWNLLNDNYELSENYTQRAITLSKEKIAPYYFDTSELFVIQGINHYMQEKYLSASDYLKTAININNNHYLAYYYLGNIYALRANDLNEGVDYYEKAFAHWGDKFSKNYYKLLYRLGYFSYRLGLKNELDKNSEQKKDFFQKSLKYWNDPQLTLIHDQMIEYCLGLIYLRLGQYNFAYAIYARQLEFFLPLRDKYEEFDFIEDVEEAKNLKLLADIYNNLGIALVGRESTTNDKIDKKRSKTMALDYFHTSTKLRKKLNLNEGDSKINFNLLLKEENLQIPIFKISDALLKQDLI